MQAVFFFFIVIKGEELVGGGSVINEACLVFNRPGVAGAVL